MSDYVSRADVTGSVEENEDGVHPITPGTHVPVDETPEEREEREGKRHDDVDPVPAEPEAPPVE